MRHDKGFLIQAREKKIKKRLFILKHIWNCKDSVYSSKPGTLNKYNLVCSCWMCSQKSKRDGYKVSDKRKMLRENDMES